MSYNSYNNSHRRSYYDDNRGDSRVDGRWEKLKSRIKNLAEDDVRRVYIKRRSTHLYCRDLK